MRFLLAVPALCAAGYWLLALVAICLRLRRKPYTTAASMPPVSILKPIHGCDPGLLDAIRSHATQDYPQFEILFGFNDPGDPAMTDVQRLAREWPERIRVVEAPNTAPNGKVGVLARLAAEARYPLFLVNDSDITVEPDYLRRIVAGLDNPRVGMVTCLYRAQSVHWPGRVEALGIATDFAPSVLVSRLLGLTRFALGASMLFRRRELERIGGFQALAGHIADDYELGLRIANLGYQVALSEVVVETALEGHSWRAVWRHQVRWARTIRRSQPAGYVGTVITQATLWSLVAATAGYPVAAWAALGLRLAAGLAVTIVLRDFPALSIAPLMPLRDLFGSAIWAAGLAGDIVDWRGQRMRLTRDGRIAPL